MNFYEFNKKLKVARNKGFIFNKTNVLKKITRVYQTYVYINT